MIYVPIIMAVVGLLFMAAKRSWVLKQDAGDGRMKEISDYIYEGALAFLKAEYRLLTFFCHSRQYRTCGYFIYSAYYRYPHSGGIYIWGCFFGPGGKYGDENCYKI